MWCRVNVEFSERLSTSQALKEIDLLSNPQIIVWYIGCYGLREAVVKFYKDFFINPILKQNKRATFWLVDLTAWNAFKYPQNSIYKVSSCCDVIEKFANDQIKCIRSATIFKKMQTISDKDFINYFRKALKRAFISKASRRFADRNIRVREIFSDNCSVMVDWYNHDVSKAYSVFQYLEGCLLIDEIFMNLMIKQSFSNLQIVFALPNDEIKYYRDKQLSFQNDVEFLISKRCATLNKRNINLQIKFFAFKYSNQLHHRPYNSPGTVLNHNELYHEDIVGHFGTINHILPRLKYAASSQ